MINHQSHHVNVSDQFFLTFYQNWYTYYWLHTSKYVSGDNLCYHNGKVSPGVNSRLLIGSYLVRILPNGPLLHHTDNHKTCIFYLEARKFKINKFSPGDTGA